MVNPGDAFPPGEDFLVRQIKDLQNQVAALSSARYALTGSAGGGVGGWAVTTSSVNVVTLTITVPPGYGTVTVMNVCTVNFHNTGAADFAYASAGINGAGGQDSTVQIGSGQYMTAAPSAIRTFDCSALTSFTVTATVSANNGFPADTFNVASVNAIAIFTK